MRLAKGSFICLAICTAALCARLSHAQTDAFARLDFGGELLIEVPRHWTYFDENLRKHLDTATEATTRLAGISRASAEHVILVAGNAQTSSRGTSATLRLSVRRGPGLTQAQMREVAKVPKAELAKLLAPVLEDTRKVLVGVDGVTGAQPSSDVRLVTNQGLLCMFFEFQTDTMDGARLSQTYLCPLGDKAVKLSTSYRVSEARLMRPVRSGLHRFQRACVECKVIPNPETAGSCSVCGK